MQEFILVLFYFVILVYSIILHEVAHGVMALWLGDKTAKYAGRLTANPLKHIDLYMTIIVPLLMFIVTQGRFAFGGAKPVPYNPYNLKNQKWGPALVGLAGPLSNIIMAVIFAIIAKLIFLPAAIKIDIINNVQMANWGALTTVVAGSFSAIFFLLSIMIIFWNILLAVFNLIPIPPLDGSKLLFSLIPIKMGTMIFLEQFGFVILLLLLFIFPGPFSWILNLFWYLFFAFTI